MFKNLTALTLLTTLLVGCGSEARLQVADGIGPHPQLPEPQPAMVPTMNIAPAAPWTDGQQPQPAAGTTVTAFAEDLQHPRWIYVLPNGDVLVAESNAPKERPEDTSGITGWIQDRLMARAGATVPSADRITLLRDADRDGRVEERTVFLEGLKSPFGMALVDRDFYVANTDAVVRFPYQPGQTRITEAGDTLVDLPAGPINHHWTKNIIASPDGRHLYATVGSNSNVAEHGMTAERGRAAIWLIDRTTGEHRIFASGLRNPNGLAWVPATGDLWTAVNERDGLGGDLVPDYMTSVDDGQFFGWPYSYFGQHVDERVEPGKPELVEAAVPPDYALGPHTASLGLAYADGTALPDELQTGMFVGQHGSWNREPRSGYKVIFVPFEGGVPAGRPVDVLTDFVDEDGQARGRPVGVALDSSGALLVADDVGNTIWRVTSASSVTARGR